MSKVKIQGNASGTGIFTVAAPATNTDRTITLPDTSSTVFTEAGGTIQAPVSINSNIDESSAYTAQLTLNSNNKATGQYARLLFQHSDHGSASIASDYESSGYGNLIFSTRNGGNPSEKMRLDANGRLLTPYQPCFHAKGGSGYVNTVILYDNIQVNVGSHYSSANGRFTAPIAGRYFFSAGMLQNGGTNTNQPEIGIRLNGTYYVRSQGQYQSGANWGYCPVTAIISMNANDYVDVYYGGSASSYGNDYAHFCGYLLG